MRRNQIRRPESKRPEFYKKRDYRQVSDTDELFASLVKIKDTDLQIFSDKEIVGKAKELALQFRLQVENYITRNQVFKSSLVPLEQDPTAPPIVKDMIQAGLATGTGPMAAVAGAIAEYVGKALLDFGCCEVIVENGGDLFVHRGSDLTIAIFAGQSPLSMQVGLKVAAGKLPLGICTSSGTVGHSLSFGTADSVTVLSGSTALADAAATRLGNEVGRERGRGSGIKKALEVGRSIQGLDGVVVVSGDKIGAVGDVELVRLS